MMYRERKKERAKQTRFLFIFSKREGKKQKKTRNVQLV